MDKEEKKVEQNPQTPPTDKKEASEKDVYEEKIAKLNSEVDHWKNEYYRAYADMQNLRKQIEADHREAIKYRSEGFVSKLLPTLDSFHFALANEASTPEMKNFLIGFEYIYKNLVSALESEGVKELAPKIGDEFNPAYMQAVETQVSKENQNKIVKVITKGYKLHDHLIRPAMVVVSTLEKKDDSNKEDKKETPHGDA